MGHPLAPALRELAVTLRERGYPEPEVEAILLRVVDDVARDRAPLLDGYLHVGAVEEQHPERGPVRHRLPAWVVLVIIVGVAGSAVWGVWLRSGTDISAPMWLKALLHFTAYGWPTIVAWAYFRKDKTLPTSVRDAAARVTAYPRHPA